MKMIEQFHLASQYLAMAGKSFLDHLEDDSHTNMGFSIADKSLLTWPLDDSGTQLGLNYKTFALDWKSNNPQSFSLEGKTHISVLDWLKSMAQGTDFEKSYKYELHYVLPYAMDDFKTYHCSSKPETEELIRLRTLAQNVLTTFLKEEKLESDVRIWPHHFDTGAFAHLHDGSGKSIGLGLAIPDGMLDDFYFYISGYRGNTHLRTWAFEPLSQGKWHNNGFKGAVLPASKVSAKTGVQFFKEALSAYKR